MVNALIKTNVANRLLGKRKSTGSFAQETMVGTAKAKVIAMLISTVQTGWGQIISRNITNVQINVEHKISIIKKGMPSNVILFQVKSAHNQTNVIHI